MFRFLFSNALNFQSKKKKLYLVIKWHHLLIAALWGVFWTEFFHIFYFFQFFIYSFDISIDTIIVTYVTMAWMG